MGHFIGDAPHIGKVHATVNCLWVSPDKPSRIDVQFISSTSALFRIDNDSVRGRVLRRHFWHIAEVPLVVHEWKPETAHLKPNFALMPIWVDFKGVPGHLFS